MRPFLRNVPLLLSTQFPTASWDSQILLSSLGSDPLRFVGFLSILLNLRYRRVVAECCGCFIEAMVLIIVVALMVLR